MEKKSYKNKSLVRQNESFQEKLELLEAKFQRIKEILKQVLKDLKNEKAQNEVLQEECAKLTAEVKEKDELLERMHSVSEAVVDEFSALRVKCDMETEAANNAIKRATRYFQENQKLRKNQFCETSLGAENVISYSCDTDRCENESELEILNNLNSKLRADIATLKTKLSKEVEKQKFLKEDFEIAKDLYEQEMRDHKCTTEKLKSLELLYDSVVQAIDSQTYSEDSNSENINKQISNTKIVNNGNCSNSSTESSNKRDVSSTLAVIEKQKDFLRNRIGELERQILNIKLNDQLISQPPPPPPPPPPSFNPIKTLLTFINASKNRPRKVSLPVQEGIVDEHQKAMTEMINTIKKGNIHLKPVPKVDFKKENTSEPLALVEMKNMLQTLKKKRKDDLFNVGEETNFTIKENDGKESCSFQIVDSEIPLMPYSTQDDSIPEKAICISESDDSFSKEENLTEEDISTTPVILPSFCDSNENEFNSPCCDNVEDKDDYVMII